MAPGNVVAIFARGLEVADYFSRGRDWTRFTANYDTVKLPDERSGTLLLFSVHRADELRDGGGVDRADADRRLHPSTPISATTRWARPTSSTTRARTTDRQEPARCEPGDSLVHGRPEDWLALARAPGLHAGHLRAAPAPAIPPQALSRSAARWRDSASAGAPPQRSATLIRRTRGRRGAGSPRRGVDWSTGGSPLSGPARRPTDPPAVLYVDGDAACWPAATRGGRQPQPDRTRPRHRHAVRAPPASSGLATSRLALGIDAAAHRGTHSRAAAAPSPLIGGLDRHLPARSTGASRDRSPRRARCLGTAGRHAAAAEGISAAEPTTPAYRSARWSSRLQSAAGR